MSKIKNIAGAYKIAKMAYKNKEQIRNIIANDGNSRGDFFETVEESTGVFSRWFKAIINGTYKFPIKTFLFAVGGALYFISPIDLIPDFFLGIGFLDDLTVIGLVIRKILREIRKFKNWENSQTARIGIIRIS